MLDTFFSVGAFVRARCLDGAVVSAASVAASAAASVAISEGFGGEGGD